MNTADRLSLGLKAGHSAARALHPRHQQRADDGSKRRRVAEREGDESGSVGNIGAIGQRGIISATALSFDTATKPSLSSSSENPNGEATSEEIIALGTLDGNIGIYSTAWLRYLASSHQQGPWDPHKMEALETIGLNAALSGWKAGLPPSRKSPANATANEEEEEEEDADAAISQLAFHPTTPYFLFVSQRRHKDRVVVYDTRYLPRRSAQGGTADGVLEFERFPGEEAVAAVLCTSLPGEETGGGNTRGEGEKYNTNQRVFFDVDWAGRWLVCGGTAPSNAEHEHSGEEEKGDGWVHVWDILEDALLSRPEEASSASDAGDRAKAKWKMPRFSFRAHDGELAPANQIDRKRHLTHLSNPPLAITDVVSSCAFHPFYPMLLTTAGSRHFPAQSFSVGEGQSESDSGESGSEGSEESSEEESEPSSASEDESSTNTNVQDVDGVKGEERGATPVLTERVPVEQKERNDSACMKVWDLR